MSADGIGIAVAVEPVLLMLGEFRCEAFRYRAACISPASSICEFDVASLLRAVWSCEKMDAADDDVDDFRRLLRLLLLLMSITTFAVEVDRGSENKIHRIVELNRNKNIKRKKSIFT